MAAPAATGLAHATGMEYLKAVSKQRPSTAPAALRHPTPGLAARKAQEYWEKRVFKNSYTRQGRRFLLKGWSVKIQHAGRRATLPLKSPTRSGAAREARRLHHRIFTQGWMALDGHQENLQPHPRELTVAFRWSDNPVVWTYATLRMQPSPARLPPAPIQPGEVASIGIVEPDRALRAALAGYVNLQRGFSSKISFPTIEEAQRELPRRTIHLLLINQDLGEQAADLLRRTPRTAPLLYSVYADADLLFTSTPSGAIGYLLKRTPPHQILDPIAGDSEGSILTRERIAASVQRYFQRLLNSWVTGSTAQALAQLTRREQEILALLSQGNLDKTIAHTLHISIWTVHGHLKHIYEKLGVHSRTEAVVKYLQQGVAKANPR